MTAVSRLSCVELLYYKKSCIRELQIDMEYGTGARRLRTKNLISTTVYSTACKFAVLTDMEELHIQMASDLPNNTLIFIFELRFRYNMEPPYS